MYILRFSNNSVGVLKRLESAYFLVTVLAVRRKVVEEMIIEKLVVVDLEQRSQKP